MDGTAQKGTAHHSSAVFMGFGEEASDMQVVVSQTLARHNTVSCGLQYCATGST